MNLLMVRHAESRGNAAGGDYSVDNADALSARGVAQAHDLAVALEAWDIDAVIASPARRALQTIAPFLAKTNRTGEVWPELAEACWQEQREPPAGSWQSEPTELSHDVSHHFRFRDGRAIRPAGPATFGTGLRRVHDAVGILERRFGGSGMTVLVSTHRYFMREMLNFMLGSTESQSSDHDNCGMTLMCFDQGWQMEFFNCIVADHIRPRNCKHIQETSS
jgi:broad specificity phosphatase PhoE